MASQESAGGLAARPLTGTRTNRRGTYSRSKELPRLATQAMGYQDLWVRLNVLKMNGMRMTVVCAEVK